MTWQWIYYFLCVSRFFIEFWTLFLHSRNWGNWYLLLEMCLCLFCQAVSEGSEVSLVRGCWIWISSWLESASLYHRLEISSAVRCYHHMLLVGHGRPRICAHCSISTLGSQQSFATEGSPSCPSPSSRLPILLLGAEGFWFEGEMVLEDG